MVGAGLRIEFSVVCPDVVGDSVGKDLTRAEIFQITDIGQSPHPLDIESPSHVTYFLVVGEVCSHVLPVAWVEQVCGSVAGVDARWCERHDPSLKECRAPDLQSEVVIVGESPLSEVDANDAGVDGDIHHIALHNRVVDGLVRDNLCLQLRQVEGAAVSTEQVDISVLVDDDHLVGLGTGNDVEDVEVAQHGCLVVGCDARVLGVVAIEVSVAQHVNQVLHLDHFGGVVVGGVDMPVSVVGRCCADCAEKEYE